MSKGALAAGLFLAAVGAAGAARATTTASPGDSDPNSYSVSLRFHEAQLATSRGVRSLYARIERTAHDVCDDPGDFALRAAYTSCERTAIADAVSQVDNTRLTAVYNEHFPGHPLAEATSLQLIPAIIVIVG